MESTGSVRPPAGMFCIEMDRQTPAEPNSSFQFRLKHANSRSSQIPLQVSSWDMNGLSDAGQDTIYSRPGTG